MNRFKTNFKRTLKALKNCKIEKVPRDICEAWAMGQLIDSNDETIKNTLVTAIILTLMEK